MSDVTKNKNNVRHSSSLLRYIDVWVYACGIVVGVFITFALFCIYFFGFKTSFDIFFGSIDQYEIPQDNSQIVPQEVIVQPQYEKLPFFWNILEQRQSMLMLTWYTWFAVFSDRHFRVWAVDPTSVAIQQYRKDAQAQALWSLQSLHNFVQSRSEKLLFAMNAGIFDTNMSPVWLFVANGRVEQPLNLTEGTWNFYLQPNGVFFVQKDKKASIMDSTNFSFFVDMKDVLLATQSWPLLLSHGTIHPSLNPSSSNTNIRNAVWITPQWTVFFVYSDKEINMYALALYMRDVLGCEHALYLDWSISGWFDVVWWYKNDNTYVWMLWVVQ